MKTFDHFYDILLFWTSMVLIGALFGHLLAQAI